MCGRWQYDGEMRRVKLRRSTSQLQAQSQFQTALTDEGLWHNHQAFQKQIVLRFFCWLLLNSDVTVLLTVFAAD